MPSCTRADVDRFIASLFSYDAVFYKSLALNDHQWADVPHSHQSGVLIPRENITFFGLDERPSENVARNLDMRWFLDGNVFTREHVPRHGGHRETCIRYYCEGNRATRPESHLTCVYNPYFEGLDDGALFVVGRRPDGDATYDALIIGPDREDLLNDLIYAAGLPESPSWGIVSLTDEEYGVAADLLDLLRLAAHRLYEDASGLPTTEATGGEVWRLLLEHEEIIRREVTCPGITGASAPFETALHNAPGNLIRWMHEKVEFSLLKHIERWHYPDQIVAAVRAEHPAYPRDYPALSGAVGDALEPIISIAKSITQSRRSRAGQSFENHVARLLDYHSLPFTRQAGEERLDFLVSGGEGDIALSAKTSTRERWKQVPAGSYFITLDRQVGPNKLSHIVARDIRLVVPETDKQEIAHYANSEYVLRYQDLIRMLI